MRHAVPYTNRVTDRGQRVIGGRFRLASRRHEPERSSGQLFSFSDGSLTATVEIGLVEGNWEPVGFDVRAYPHETYKRSVGRLTVRALRKVPFGALVDEALILLTEDLEEEQAAAGPVLWVDDDGHHTSIDAAAVKRGLERLQGPGRPSLTYEQLVETARLYNAFARVSRRPTSDLAKHLHLSRSGAAKRVQRARAAGLIPPPRRGGS